MAGPPLRTSLPRILLATAVVAAADLADAIIVWVGVFQRSTVPRILQSIAAGLLGPAAYQGGTATALLGLGLHVLVALGWTGVFFVLFQRWARLRDWMASRRGAVLVGLAYGAAVWLLMDGVVLPLSRARVTPLTAPWFWIQLATHPFVVGLPIALIVGGVGRRATRRSSLPLGRPSPGER